MIAPATTSNPAPQGTTLGVPENGTVSTKPKRKARTPKVAPPPKPPRAPVVRVVTAYLVSQSQYHAEAADVLGVEFKRDLRDELAVDARRTALVSRRDSLEHDLEQVAEALNACVPTKSCRARLDKFAAQLAEAKGAVPHVEDAPTEADRRGVEIPL